MKIITFFMRGRVFLGTFLIAALISGAAVILPPAELRAADLPFQNQALLLLRTLAYDRNLKARATDKVTIAILYDGGSSSSKAVRDGIDSALKSLAKRMKVSGLPLSIVPVPFSNSGLERTISALNATVIYVCPGLDSKIRAISTVTRKHSILSVSGQRPSVVSGLSVGFVAKDGRAGLVVNLPAVKKEGVTLDSVFLSRADIIR